MRDVCSPDRLANAQKPIGFPYASGNQLLILLVNSARIGRCSRDANPSEAFVRPVG
jgi:hypothetical protein